MQLDVTAGLSTTLVVVAGADASRVRDDHQRRRSPEHALERLAEILGSSAAKLSSRIMTSPPCNSARAMNSRLRSP